MSERDAQFWKRQIARFGPQMGQRPLREILRAAVGSGLALLICAGAMHVFPHARETGLYLVGGFGALAVLLFVLPNSPLAQPYSAFVGMIVSPFVALLVLKLVPPPFADGLAVTAAIAAMLILRALHPPAAGLALLTVLQYDTGTPFGFGFILMPVAVVTIAMICLAILWNNAFGVAYPAPAVAPPTPEPTTRTRSATSAPLGPMQLTETDINELLLEQRLSTNVVASDVAGLVHAATARATRMLLDRATVGQIMTPAPEAISPLEPLSGLVALMTRYGVKSLPVVGSDGRFQGIVNHNDVMRALSDEMTRARSGIMRLGAPPPEPLAGTLLRNDISPVTPDTAVGTLLARLGDFHARAIPVIEGGQLIGMVSRSDLSALLIAQLPGANPQSKSAQP